jgi:hypothetical protein
MVRFKVKAEVLVSDRTPGIVAPGVVFRSEINIS